MSEKESIKAIEKKKKLTRTFEGPMFRNRLDDACSGSTRIAWASGKQRGFKVQDRRVYVSTCHKDLQSAQSSRDYGMTRLKSPENKKSRAERTHGFPILPAYVAHRKNGFAQSGTEDATPLPCGPIRGKLGSLTSQIISDTFPRQVVHLPKYVIEI